MRPLLTLSTVAAVVLGAAPLGAQSAAPATPCSYDRCALAVEPRWNALALARGTTAEPVGRLGFFWPGDVRPLFAGSDSALHHARHAVTTRRVAAVLTDAGAALLIAGVVRNDRRLTGAGAIAFTAGVPLQFAADGALARAVWWYNQRFAQ